MQKKGNCALLALFFHRRKQKMSQLLKQQIHYECNRLGAARSRVSSPCPPSEDFERYCSWLHSGMADMEFLAKNKEPRRDVRIFWPPTRSVICVAIPFDCGPWTEKERAEGLLSSPLHGYIASYAKGRDYHIKVYTLLKELGDQLSLWTKGKAEHRICVDTAPILERSLGSACGLGRIGRNKCLIVPDVGSRVVLGELLLNIDLPSDPPLEGDPCGECNLCVKSCPTGALTESGELISSHCLSYLTIENKKIIQSTTLIKAIENRLFGCDTCLSVCPHNQLPISLTGPLGADFWSRNKPKDLFLNNSSAWIDLGRLAKLGSGEIRRTFQVTSMSRLSASTIRRNLCVVLANSHSPDATSILKSFLNSPSKIVRETAESLHKSKNTFL